MDDDTLIEEVNDSSQRTYINNVLVKVLVSDVINTGYKSDSKKKEYLEQKFKVNKQTSFKDML